MGRHGQPSARRRLPWELVGWGAFAVTVAAVSILWLGGSWPTAVLVAGAGAAGIGAVVIAAVVAPSRSARGSRRRPPP